MGVSVRTPDLGPLILVWILYEIGEEEIGSEAELPDDVLRSRIGVALIRYSVIMPSVLMVKRVRGLASPGVDAGGCCR